MSLGKMIAKGVAKGAKVAPKAADEMKVPSKPFVLEEADWGNIDVSLPEKAAPLPKKAPLVKKRTVEKSYTSEESDTNFKKFSEGSELGNTTFYTGTSKDVDFESFKAPRNGIWFTKDPKIASEYAVENDSKGLKYNNDTRRYDEVNSAARVIPTKIAMRKPYRITEWPDEVRKSTNYKKAQEIFFDRLKAQGYDGVVLGDNDVVVAFTAEQVKSKFNKGSWDASNKKMNFNKGGVVDQTQQMLQSGFAAGGMKQDPVSGNEVPVGALPHEVRDDVDAKLSEGEFVIPADVVRFIGLQKLMQLRDKAKEGLERMASMGQMGNADEAKANGENPLGEFDEEDDDGFEAEIDDIMGGEVEMATGGAVPSKGNVLGQDSSTYHWGNIANVQGARRESASDYSAPKITEALRKLGYQGPSTYTEIPSDKAFLAKELGVDSAEIEAVIGDSVNPNQAGWRQQEYLDSLRNQVVAKNIQNFLSEKGFNVETWNTGAENISQLRDNEGNVLAVDANNYARTNARNDRNALAAGAAFMGGAMLYGGALGGTGAGAGAGEGATATGGNVSYLSPSLTGSAPVVSTPGLTAADIGFGTIGKGGAYTAGLTGGAELAKVPLSGEVFGKSAGEVLKDKAIDKVQSEAVKEGVKTLAPAPSPSKQSGIPSWLVGAGLGAAAGSALGGGSSSPAPSSKTEIPRGNNPVVDYRPADAQTEELFINNRPTGKKKKKGFAAGGDVNLDAYNFFNQQD